MNEIVNQKQEIQNMEVSSEILQTVIISPFHNYIISKIHNYITVAAINGLGPLKTAKNITDSQPYSLSISKISKTGLNIKIVTDLASLTVWD